MLHKARLFFSTMAISLFLVACTDVPAEETSNVDILEETPEAQTDTNQESETSEVETETSEEIPTNEEDKNEPTEDTAEAESNSSVEANSSAAENESEAELLESIDQAAIDQFVTTTGLNIEDYTFSFETTDEYVEITVYEKQ